MKRVRFKSLTESFIDTTEKSAQSKFIINIFAVLAEMEGGIIMERTKAGLESAKLRGQVLGRRRGLTKEAEEKAMLCAYHFNEGILSVPNILKEVGVFNYLLQIS